jgi:hypothetical protein
MIKKLEGVFINALFFSKFFKSMPESSNKLRGLKFR